MKKKLPVFTDKGPSEIMMELASAGSIAADCTACGRTHFNAFNESESFYEEGELERYIERNAKNPDECCAHDHSISFININGEQIVVDCPCNRLRMVEDFIWGHRYLIADYLRQRIKGQAQSVECEKANIAGIAEGLRL